MAVPVGRGHVRSKGAPMFDRTPVTVMGLGHFGGGVAAARWLARQGARVTVTDLAPADRLQSASAALAGVPLANLVFGEHREQDFQSAEFVVVNPAVRPGHPLVELARSRGATITTEIGLFLDHCPARVVGVTGSNGKSTTTAMTAAALRAGSGERVWLGGNIGVSLLDRLDTISADDWVVLELSSFQLSYLAPLAHPPKIALVTNCTPNHLNWHPDFAHYVEAKQQLIASQRPDDVCILNPLDPEVATWTHCASGRVEQPVELTQLPPLRVPGEHNRVNASLAAAAARAAGRPMKAIQGALAAFAGLPQRLEMVGVVGGRRFYNDSSATTPESTIAALEALSSPVWLLAGGLGKGADWSALIETIAARAHAAAFYGKVGPEFHGLLANRAPTMPSCLTATLAAALAWCWKNSKPGDAIVLSPACASTDQFTNYEHRGRVFNAIVAELAASPDRPGLVEPPPSS